jgi:hypothetical protein
MAGQGNGLKNLGQHLLHGVVSLRYGGALDGRKHPAMGGKVAYRVAVRIIAPKG